MFIYLFYSDSLRKICIAAKLIHNVSKNRKYPISINLWLALTLVKIYFLIKSLEINNMKFVYSLEKSRRPHYI